MVFLHTAVSDASRKDSVLPSGAHDPRLDAETTQELKEILTEAPAGVAEKVAGTAQSTSYRTQDRFLSSTVYGTRWAQQDIPRFEMPENEMPPGECIDADELALDGNPVLNLASFVTTYMEEEAEKLMAQNMSKNFIDYEEYPQTAEIQARCVNMIARLFNCPVDSPSQETVGCSTIGSSEAIILCTLAMKRRWQEARRAKGLDASKPNLVMGANVQVCWEKAVKYLEIEPRYVYCTDTVYTMIPENAVELCDENTIGVAAILGSTYTGHYEDVKTLNKLLIEKNKELGTDIGIHVDAASGGFVAPFVDPELEWDFRLERVISINVSGHKYGLTYAGVGWAVWRSAHYLPDDLVFHINYLGSDQASFTLNFSKGAANVIAQYYVLIRLGRSGFASIMNNLTCTSDYLAGCLEKTGRFTILSETGGKGLPLVAWKLKEKHHYDELLRVVVREDFSRARCEMLIKDILMVVKQLDKQDKKAIETSRNDRRAKQHWAALRHVNKAFGIGAKLKKEEDKVSAIKTTGVC
ncbi:hypothetical protein BZG36_04690 [Bifiguratus adelaidae]|uniref:Glutamate decarboxylase n=1 Tax=Bifiguratus adelaidae TaxID=1938954 RepID=A0A261XUS7_9FUNG|nr:hypothetical protein BZG36_04690 [Bifiguratus adelaidae]